MLITGDCLEVLPTLEAESVQCCVTSPPYWGLRDYGIDSQIGLERTPEEYVDKMVMVFREVRRVLRDDGVLWLNLGDSYVANKTGGLSLSPSLMTGGRATQEAATERPNKTAAGLKPKDLCGIPWRVALALQADGWWLRQDIIWNKPNPMPESVTDRCTKAHEYIFLLTKSARYFYDAAAVKEPGTPQHPSALNFARATKEAEVPGQLHKQHRLDRIPTAGKWSREDPQSSGRRIVESVKLARAQGNDHDNPFGLTRNRRSVWTITTKPFKEAHFATFPPEIPEICIKAGSRPGDTILDPFSGSGTTGNVAERLGRKYIGIELNPKYADMGENRINAARLPLMEGING